MAKRPKLTKQKEVELSQKMMKFRKEAEDGNKGTFVFANVDETFVTEYDLGKTRVEPVSFNNAIKQLTTSVRRMS